LIQGQIWRAVKNFNANLLLVHARAASYGEPSANINNHPFVSSDWNLGLVHNGCITEYDELRLKYEVLSRCDSEILLRMIEAGPNRLEGIQTVLSHIRAGHMAVAVGEKGTSSRDLYLFRNQHRTLWAFDLRDTLGQIFFCSTPDIWLEAVAQCRLSRRFLGRETMVDLPTNEVWHLQTNSGKFFVQRYRSCYTTESPPPEQLWTPIRRSSPPQGKCLSVLSRHTPGPPPTYLQNCEELKKMLVELNNIVSLGLRDDEEVDYVFAQAKGVISDCLKTAQAHCK
jgi:hypothetical protein